MYPSGMHAQSRLGKNKWPQGSGVSRNEEENSHVFKRWKSKHPMQQEEPGSRPAWPRRSSGSNPDRAASAADPHTCRRTRREGDGQAASCLSWVTFHSRFGSHANSVGDEVDATFLTAALAVMPFQTKTSRSWCYDLAAALAGLPFQLETKLMKQEESRIMEQAVGERTPGPCARIRVPV